MKRQVNKTPNDFKEDFFHIGERVGRINKHHPDKIIQEVWDAWMKNFGNLEDWYDAFKNWERGFLKGINEK